MKFVQLQYDNVKQESARLDEQLTTINQQCKQYQNQMEVCFSIVNSSKILITNLLFSIFVGS